MHAFLSWISFSYGGFSEAAICEGFSEHLLLTIKLYLTVRLSSHMTLWLAIMNNELRWAWLSCALLEKKHHSG